MSDSGFAEAQVDGVREVIANLRDAVNAGDAARVYEITADDFEMMAPGQASLSGTSARESLAGIVSHFIAELKPFTNEQIIVSGDWAFQRYSYELTLTPRGGGSSSTQRGDGIHVFRKDASGTWRLAKDVFTSVSPAAAGA